MIRPSFSPLILLLVAAPIFPAQAEEKVRFNRDIRPIFSDTCFQCHGPDEAKRKAGLRLDTREPAVNPAESGEIAIVPGKPEASEIVRRLTTTDKDDRMPPAKLHKKITPAQIETVKRWIAQGAEYQGHWARRKVRHGGTPWPALGTSALPGLRPLPPPMIRPQLSRAPGIFPLFAPSSLPNVFPL